MISSVTPAPSALATTWTVIANVTSIDRPGLLWLELVDDDSIRTGPAQDEGSHLGGPGVTNSGNGSFTGQAYETDRQRPTAAVALAAGQGAATHLSTARFAVNFNEPVTGFDAADIAGAGGGPGVGIAVAPTGPTAYEVTLTNLAVGRHDDLRPGRPGHGPPREPQPGLQLHERVPRAPGTAGGLHQPAVPPDRGNRRGQLGGHLQRTGPAGGRG